MELVYRGQRYQAEFAPSQSHSLKFPCVYRGVPYQITYAQPAEQSIPQTVKLTYRGAPYTRTL